jgi:signal transduction histidine kinase
MNIRTRLILAFSVLTALIVFPNLILLNNLWKDEKILTDMTVSLEAANVRLTGIMASFVELRVEASKMGVYMLQEKDTTKPRVSTKRFIETADKLKNEIDYLGSLSPKHKEYANQLAFYRGAFSDNYTQLSSFEDFNNKAHYYDKISKFLILHDSVNNVCKTTLTFLNDLVFEQDKRARDRTQSNKLFFIIISILGIGIAFMATFYTLNRLLTPLNSMIAATKKIGKGDYNFRLKDKRKDEFGLLGASFNQMLDDLNHSKLIENQKKELEKLNDDLKIKNDSLDSFVYRVSHDLKAPIINTTSLLSLIKKRVSQEDKFLNQTFGFIDDSIKRLQTTIYDLLEVSRIERNLQSEKQELDINEVLGGIKEQFREMIRKEEAEILTDFTEGGPYVFFSEANMKSILSNIVSNAIKYRSPDRKPVISLTTVIEGDYLKFTIEDNGMGFDRERHSDNLFKMFSRFHSHVEGSGVGLYIVHKLITDSGGKIVVESEVSKGTIFNLYFKINPEPSYV